MTSEEDAVKMTLASPTLFSTFVLKIKPTRYQADVLETDGNSIVLWGRQTGKTTTLATKALHRALTHPKQEILIIAPTQRQAALMFSKIHDFTEYNEFVKAHTKRSTLNDIEFDSGSRIHCLPAGREGTSIRGFSATMIIFDEAAFIPDATFMALRPSMAVRGEQVVLSGTPFGRRGYFWNQYKNNSMKRPALQDWDMFKVPSRESPFIEEAFLRQQKEEMTADVYAQEYEAEFTADNDSFFPAHIVAPNLYEYNYALPMMKDLPRESKLMMGVDIARAGADETAFVICSITKDDYVKVEWVETHSKSKITETAGRVVELAGEYPEMQIYMDESGLGAGALDIVKERNVSNATGVVFSTDMRNRMYSGVKLALEQNRLKLNESDRKMIDQFSNYTGKQTSEGRWHIVKGEKHDDCVDALALCFSGETDIEAFPFEEGLDLSPFRRAEKLRRLKIHEEGQWAGASL